MAALPNDFTASVLKKENNRSKNEKALVKRFCEKNFTEFLLDLKKWSAFFYLPPCAGSVQKQDFVNNQILTKRALILHFYII